jgi:hypothetical protein
LDADLTTPHCEKSECYETLHRASDLGGFFGMTQEKKNEMRFGALDNRSLYRAFQ